jgi:hypothetical protein
MKSYNHIVDRNLIEWTSFGKFHNEPARKTLIRDLSDSHLMRIVEWIENNPQHYTADILNLMKDEVDFRAKNYIFVADTY